MIFIGTGEHIPDFEVFEVNPFVSRLLGQQNMFNILCDSSFQFTTVYLTLVYLSGMGDLSGLVNKFQEFMPDNQQPQIMDKLGEGTFTLRLLYEMFQNLQRIGPLGQVSYRFIDISVIKIR